MGRTRLASGLMVLWRFLRVTAQIDTTALQSGVAQGEAMKHDALVGRLVGTNDLGFEILRPNLVVE